MDFDTPPHSSVLCWSVWFAAETHPGDEVMELVMGETFGESVGKVILSVILSRNMGEFNGVVEHFLSEIVVSHVDMLGAIMSNGILGELNGGIVVIENGEGTRDRVTKRFEKSAEPDYL
jgi:hypothetical protein